MASANKRRRYNVTSSLIGWVYTQNDSRKLTINTSSCQVDERWYPVSDMESSGTGNILKKYDGIKQVLPFKILRPGWIHADDIWKPVHWLKFLCPINNWLGDTLVTQDADAFVRHWALMSQEPPSNMLHWSGC